MNPISNTSGSLPDFGVQALSPEQVRLGGAPHILGGAAPSLLLPRGAGQVPARSWALLLHAAIMLTVGTCQAPVGARSAASAAATKAPCLMRMRGNEERHYFIRGRVVLAHLAKW